MKNFMLLVLMLLDQTGMILRQYINLFKGLLIAPMENPSALSQILLKATVLALPKELLSGILDLQIMMN